MTKCSCIVCRVEKSVKGIHTHYLIAHTAYGESHKVKSEHASKLASVVNTKTATDNRVASEATYLLAPNFCEECSCVLYYNIRNNKFCSHSCAATSINAKRDSESVANKQKITLKSNYYHIDAAGDFSVLHYNTCVKCGRAFTSSRPKKTCGCRKSKPEVVGPYTKLYRCSCKVCHCKFLSPSVRQFCEEHKDYHSNKRSEYRFQFNIYDYPDLFDLDQINRVGFYASGGKSGRWNVNGLSRDHKVSVDEAIRNNYDIYYITHPINCELMPHSENNKKKRQSSISYDVLVQAVDDYDTRRLPP